LGSVGDRPSLVRLSLHSCKCLTTLTGVAGSYPALRGLAIKYCPAIDMKPLYKHHRGLTAFRKETCHTHIQAIHMKVPFKSLLFFSIKILRVTIPLLLQIDSTCTQIINSYTSSISRC